MAKMYFTIAGCNHYHGTDFMKPGMKVKLEKDPKNEYDKEAIKVKVKGLGLCGFVANSTYTVEGDTMSAGRLYDKIGKKAKAKVVYVLPNRAVCKVIKEKKNEDIGEEKNNSQEE